MRALERDKLIFRNLMNHCIMALQPQEQQEKEQSMALTLMRSGCLNKGLRLWILEHSMRVQVMSLWYDVCVCVCVSDTSGMAAPACT